MDALALALPATWAAVIYAAKGILALSGVLLLLWHMDHQWPLMTDPAQRARYLLLLGYGVFQAGATVEQLNDVTPLGWRHVGALILSAALAAVAGYSIYTARRTP